MATACIARRDRRAFTSERAAIAAVSGRARVLPSSHHRADRLRIPAGTGMKRRNSLCHLGAEIPAAWRRNCLARRASAVSAQARIRTWDRRRWRAGRWASCAMATRSASSFDRANLSGSVDLLVEVTPAWGQMIMATAAPRPATKPRPAGMTSRLWAAFAKHQRRHLGRGVYDVDAIVEALNSTGSRTGSFPVPHDLSVARL